MTDLQAKDRAENALIKLECLCSMFAYMRDESNNQAILDGLCIILDECIGALKPVVLGQDDGSEGGFNMTMAQVVALAKEVGAHYDDMARAIEKVARMGENEGATCKTTA